MGSYGLSGESITKRIRKSGWMPRGILMLIFAVLMSLGFNYSVNAAFVRVDFSQCSNENNTLGQCVWIGSNVQNNNSLYIEGMALPQRLIFDGITNRATAPVTTHEITFVTQWTKGGKHAYDFLTSYAQAQTLSTAIGGFSLTLNECADLPNTGSPPTVTGECNAVRGVSGFYTPVTVPDDSYVSGQCDPGLCNTQDRINAFETLFGNRTIDVYTDQPVTATLTMVHKADCTQAPVLANGADAGDTEQCWTLTVVPTNTANPPTIILVQAAGHIAPGWDPETQNNVGWGGQFSAGNISGSPYHVKEPKLDGSGGSQDNQLNASAIPNRPLSLVTQLTPTSGTFPFSVQDTATLTGDNTLGSPLGKVYFYVCGPTVSPTACSISNGKQVGSPVNLTTGAGNTSTATSTGYYLPNVSGYYCFSIAYVRARITPFDEYSNQTSTVTTNECVQLTSNPTAAELVSFDAGRVQDTKAVRTKWSTGSEANIVGFNVWRAREGGSWKKLTAAAIPAQYLGQVQGGEYKYIDGTAKKRFSYRYKLEVLAASGSSEWSRVETVKAVKSTADPVR